MTTTLEQSTTKGDAAIEIIDEHRATVNDHTRLDPLETEFNTLAHYLRSLGAGSLHLLYADDNQAGTFKWRGAFNKAAALKEQGVERVVVPSAGNHARGAVLAARHFDLEATIVVPTTAPPAKKEGLRDLWPSTQLRIIAQGDNFNQSLEYALDHPELGIPLHPFDDPDVIAGQGTLADDLDRSTSEPVNHIVVPVGGGGLLAGLAQRLAEQDNTRTQLHAVEPVGSNSLSRSLTAGEPVEVEQPNSRYGGSAVQKIGIETFRIIWENRDRISMHMVSEEAVDATIADYLSDQRDWRWRLATLEPTTIVAVAGLEHVILQRPGESVAVIGTGHNAPLI